jgi:hypothetical protein
MKDEIPRFNLRIIESSDHWVIAENPKALDKASMSFYIYMKLNIKYYEQEFA